MSRTATPRAPRLALFLCFAMVASYGPKKSCVDYGGGPDSSHFVESKQITKANVGQLEVAWSYPYALTTFNPIIVTGTMYLTGRGALIPLDATSGTEIWIHEGLQVLNPRGINHWQSKDGKDRRRNPQFSAEYGKLGRPVLR